MAKPVKTNGKLKTKDVIDLLVAIINKEPAAARFTPLPKKYRTLEPELGRRLIAIESDKKVLTLINEEAMVDDLLTHCREVLVLENSALVIQYREGRDVIKYWRSVTKPIQGPVVWVAFASELDKYTYCRLKFDPVPNNSLVECPTWSELLSRMSNSEAFCKRIASIFDPDADLKQAIYMSGPQDSGKSQVASLLGKMLGFDAAAGSGGYVTISNDDLKSNHWKDVMVGKRVLAITEAGSQFLSTDVFKALTGDRYHNINPKGKPMFRAELSALIFMFSNDPPRIDSDSAKITRIIDCRVKAVTSPLIPEKKYQAMLLSELPNFLGYCFSLYDPCKGHRIESSQDDLKLTIEEHESDAADFFDLFFELDDKSHLESSQVFKIITGEKINPKTYHIWRETWLRTLPIEFKKIAVKKSQSRKLAFIGMKLKESSYTHGPDSPY